MLSRFHIIFVSVIHIIDSSDSNAQRLMLGDSSVNVKALKSQGTIQSKPWRMDQKK